MCAGACFVHPSSRCAARAAPSPSGDSLICSCALERTPSRTASRVDACECVRPPRRYAPAPAPQRPAAEAQRLLLAKHANPLGTPRRVASGGGCGSARARWRHAPRLANGQEKRGARGEGQGARARVAAAGYLSPSLDPLHRSALHCITRSHLEWQVRPTMSTPMRTAAVSGKCCPTPTCAKPDVGPSPEDVTFGEPPPPSCQSRCRQHFQIRQVLSLEPVMIVSPS